MTLRIDRQVGSDFTGTIEYEHGGMTEMAGRIWTGKQALRDDAGWRGIGTQSEVAIVFRELRAIREGRQSISLDGEYRAFIEGDRMSGGWFSGGALLGTFVFIAEG